MPTPLLYARFADACSAFEAKRRGVVLVVALTVAFVPPLLEHTVPSVVGTVPGKVLFVALLALLAAAAPLLAFRKALPLQPWTAGQVTWAWTRALLCSAWVLLCIWFVFTGLTGRPRI